MEMAATLGQSARNPIVATIFFASAASCSAVKATKRGAPVVAEVVFKWTQCAGGRLTTGETVTDWRRVWGRPPNVDVAVEADIDRFFERFIERVGSLASRG